MSFLSLVIAEKGFKAVEYIQEHKQDFCVIRGVKDSKEASHAKMMKKAENILRMVSFCFRRKKQGCHQKKKKIEEYYSKNEWQTPGI